MDKMVFKAVELKNLNQETIDKIRIWRNQPFVKKNSFSQHDITIEEHRHYIQNLLMDENRGLYVFYLDNEPFGVFNYEMKLPERYVTCSDYLINEDYSFLGYGTILRYYMCRILFEDLRAAKTGGEVLEQNKASLDMCKGSKQLDSIYIGEKELNIYRIETDYSDWQKNRIRMEKLMRKIIVDVDNYI